jgi:Zn-dependent protease
LRSIANEMAVNGKPDRAPAPRRPGAIFVARLFGVPIYVTSSWVLLSVLLVFIYGPIINPDATGIVPYLLGASIVVMLLVTVLLHELGHAAAARRYRVGVRGITLDLLGGYTEMGSEAKTPGAEATIALAGPGVSLVLAAAAGLALTAADRHGVAGELLFQLAVTNVLVGVFNALPGLPLDGGRALRAAVWRLSHDQIRAEIVAAWAGRVVALATAAAAIGATRYTHTVTPIGLLVILLIAASMWRGASQSLQLARLKQRLERVSAGAMARRLFVVPTGTPLSEALRQRDESMSGHRERDEGLEDRDDEGAEPSGIEADLPVVIGVEDSLGRLLSLVNPRAVAAIPPQRRPWVEVDSVARSVVPASRIPADSSGSEVLAAVAANPQSDLLVTVGEDVVGVLRIADVVTMMRSRGPHS